MGRAVHTRSNPQDGGMGRIKIARITGAGVSTAGIASGQPGVDRRASTPVWWRHRVRAFDVAVIALIGVLVIGSSTTALRAQGDQQPGDELAALAAALHEPGPEAASRRQGAIFALLLRKDSPAHEVLQRAVLDPQSVAGCAQSILESLAVRIGQPQDPVFGDAEARARLVPLWGRVLARVFVAEGEEPGALPNAAALRGPALDGLRSLGVRERAQLLEALAAAEPSGLRRAALRMAGESRDVTLGAFLADRLGDSQLADTARGALARLTFVAEPFADRAAFERWQADHAKLTYLELAERAALDAQRHLEDARRAADARALDLRLQLVRALARTQSTDWRALSAATLGDGDGRETLAALCGELAGRVLGGEDLGGVVQDRVDFAAALAGRLDAGERPGEQALLLEALAYVSPGGPAGPPPEVVARLRAGLLSSDVAVRRAALRGMRRVPTETGRGWVVEAARQARVERDNDTLTGALECLRAPGYRAPSAEAADRAAWIAVLGEILRDGRAAPGIRERALDVAILRDGTRGPVAELFDVLLEVSRDDAAPIALRKLTVPRLMLFATDPASASRYVDALLGLLEVADPALRRVVAEQVATLPDGPTQELGEWRKRVVRKLSERILFDDDDRVGRRMIETLLSFAGEELAIGQVVGEFVAVAQRLSAVQDSSLQAWRRHAVVDALRVLSLDPRLDLANLLRLGEGLVALRAREGLLQLLERSELARADATDGTALARARLIVAAADLAPDPLDWTGREAEAARVVAAVDLLRRQSGAEPPAEQAVLQLEAICATGDSERTLQRGAELVAGPSLSSPLRARVEFVRARAHLARGELAEAARALLSLEATDELPVAAVDLWLELARARLAAREFTAAAELADRLLPRLADRPVRWRACFLLACEARLLGGGPSAALAADLDAHAPRFRTEATPAADRDRFESLLQRARGDG